MPCQQPVALSTRCKLSNETLCKRDVYVPMATSFVHLRGQECRKSLIQQHAEHAEFHLLNICWGMVALPSASQ